MKLIKSLVFNTIAILGLFLAMSLSAIASIEAEKFTYDKALAEQGSATHQNYLGSHYKYGEGVRQDYSKAIFWFKKSTDQGNAQGQFELGNLYFNGQGVNQDYKKAMYWYKKGSEQRHSASQYMLGLIHHYGREGVTNKSVAKEWYGKSCDNGEQLGCDEYRTLNQEGY